MGHLISGLAVALLLAACDGERFQSFTLGPLGTLHIGPQAAVEEHCRALGATAPPTYRIVGCAPNKHAYAIDDPAIIAHEVCHLAGGDEPTCKGEE